MSASPAMTLRESPRDEVRWRLTQDLFMHVATASRTVGRLRREIDRLTTEIYPTTGKEHVAIDAKRSARVADLTVELENAITDVCGRTARAVVGRAELMALAFSDEQRSDTWLHALSPDAVDELASAIYGESGMLEDFRAHNVV